MPPPHRAVWRLSVCVCLSRTSGLSREQRGLGRPKLAQRWPTSHVTRTLLSRPKGQRSRLPGRFTHRGVYASSSCIGEHGNVFTVGTYCYVAVRRGRLGGARRFGAHRGRRRAGAYCGGRPPTACYAPAPSAGVLSDDAVWRLTSVWRLTTSVANIRHKSRTQEA